MISNTATKDDSELLGILRKTFIDEATSFLTDSEAALVRLDDPEQREESLGMVFRAYHSVKGSAASVGYGDIAQFSHTAEDCLSILRSKPELVTREIVSILLQVNDCLRTRIVTLLAFPSDETGWHTEPLEAKLKEVIASLKDNSKLKVDSAAHPTMGFFDTMPGPAKAQPAPASGSANGPALDKSKIQSLALKIDAAKVDAVMDMVGELVVIKSQLVETIPPAFRNEGRTKAVIGLLDKSVRELHEKTLAMRMLSLKTSFLKIQRMARDLSEKLDKPIAFEMSGEDTELDRALIEQLSDPLMHLCRNAIDHGIEAADERIKAGKPREGRVSLKAFRRGEGVMIEISDDGGGVSRKRVVDHAVKRGLLAQDIQVSDLNDAQVFDLMFQPGFSTAKEVTDVSGRGVGLDVVKSNIAAIKGRVEVESKEGQGTCFKLMIPLTTAITDGIIVEMKQQKYVVPIECVKSFVESKQVTIVPMHNDKTAIGVGSGHYPLLNAPGIAPEKPITEALFLLLDVMDRTVALAVDGVHGKTQVVLKSVRGSVDKSGYFSGAAVMGDGKVALVLDVIGLTAATEQFLNDNVVGQ